jgi:replicative DNA helicase
VTERFGNGTHHGRRNGSGNGVDRSRLPQALDAEASILGGILIRNQVLDRLDTLEVGHFYDGRHKIVFAAMRALQAIERPIDVVTLEVEIEKQGKLEALGGVAFLGELLAKVPTADNVIAYAKIVRDRHLLREVMLRTSAITERGYTWEDEPDELLGEALADLQKLERGYREQNEKVPIITIGGAMEELERLASTPVYETPFPAMNSILGFGGLLSGQIYYLAGGTGAGKTSWIGALVRHHASQGRHALVAFYEMFAGYYCARMSAGELGVHSNDILRGKVSPREVMRVLPPQIEFLDGPTLPMLKRAIERHTRMGRPAPLVVIDYVQLLADQIQATMTRPDPRMANALASTGLRVLAKETGAAIVIVSAASRSTGRRLTQDVRKEPPRSLIDAAKESGAIEYDGAGVIVLSISDEKDGDENVATMTVAKARFGEAHHLDARTDGRTGAWRELGRVEHIGKTSTTPTAAQGAVRESILRVLRGTGPLQSKTKIFRLSGKAKAAIFSEIDVMLDDGTLELAGGAIAIAGIRTEAPSQAAIPGVE